MRNRKVLRPPLLENLFFFIDNWILLNLQNEKKSKGLIINNRQYNVTVSDKDPSSDKTKTIPSATKRKKNWNKLNWIELKMRWSEMKWNEM